jgi:hypothetical protein
MTTGPNPFLSPTDGAQLSAVSSTLRRVEAGLLPAGRSRPIPFSSGFACQTS